MDLYDNPFSPYAFKVRATLYEKGAPHEQREIQKQADHARPLRVNPRGEVPALVVDGTPDLPGSLATRLGCADRELLGACAAEVPRGGGELRPGMHRNLGSYR